ncbi:MAG TPA: AmmeMemoRadiSam system protein B, partial [Chloroflexota bacterium]|nr:AmmeMemoRadiSam system protein B [Chloroflexota bacterium]
MSESQLDWRPRLRPVDVQAARANGELVYCLRDRLDPQGPTLVVSPQALLLLSLFDGTRDLRGVQIAFALRTGQTLPLDQIAAIAEQLDEAYLLAGPRYDAHEAAQRAAFAALPRRPAIHAGGAYAGEPAALEAALDGYFAAEGGPGLPAPPAARRELVGLIAPHVDLHRGGPTYAWAYRALAEAVAPELVVLLGTCHAPMNAAFAATTKDYDTPFGPLPTDAAFVHELAARYRGDGGVDGVPALLVEEYAHRGEHALE